MHVTQKCILNGIISHRRIVEKTSVQNFCTHSFASLAAVKLKLTINVGDLLDRLLIAIIILAVHAEDHATGSSKIMLSVDKILAEQLFDKVSSKLQQI